ncbi:hypothetical protein D3C77_335550 [compost metagenome]
MRCVCDAGNSSSEMLEAAKTQKCAGDLIVYDRFVDFKIDGGLKKAVHILLLQPPRHSLTWKLPEILGNRLSLLS